MTVRGRSTSGDGRATLTTSAMEAAPLTMGCAAPSPAKTGHVKRQRRPRCMRSGPGLGRTATNDDRLDVPCNRTRKRKDEVDEHAADINISPAHHCVLCVSWVRCDGSDEVAYLRTADHIAEVRDQMRRQKRLKRSRVSVPLSSWLKRSKDMSDALTERLTTTAMRATVSTWARSSGKGNRTDPQRR